MSLISTSLRRRSGHPDIRWIRFPPAESAATVLEHRQTLEAFLDRLIEVGLRGDTEE